MFDTIKERKGPGKIDRAFENAVIVSWEDLATHRPRSIHLEYLFQPGIGIDHLTIWAVKDGGYQDLMCDYRTEAGAAHPVGARFEGDYCSARLSHDLAFILKNQALFTRAVDAGREGLVQIHPPNDAERAEATTWLEAMEGMANRQAEARSHTPLSQELSATSPDATGYSR